MKKTKNIVARRIYDLSERIKADKDEMEELREALQARMKPGQAIGFDTPEGPYRLKLCECEETILEENEKIFDTIGKRRFLVAAKVGLGGLKKALDDLPEEGGGLVLAMKACTKAIVTKNTLKLLKGKE